MIWLLKPDQPKATEFAPAMDESTGILSGLPAVAGKPVHVAFDGGRLTSDAGILLLAAVEQRLGIAKRLADCIEDPRAPERVRHGLAEMIRYRALLIAAGYPDGTDCDALKSDPAFKMEVGRLPESGADLCSQPTVSRLENLPGPTALKRMMAAMVDLFCDSFEEVPRRIVLDIDDTEDRVHGGQQLALFNAYYDSRCFQPIHIYEATTGKPVAIILRPGKTPDGAEVTRQPFRRDRQARMHQKPAHRVHPETAGFVLAAVDPVGDADLLGPLQLVRKLRRVLEHQDRPLRRGKAAPGRLKITCQDLRLTDPLIGEEAIGRLGVCPILAGQRNARPHGAVHSLQQLAQSLVQTHVGKSAASKLAIKPCVGHSVHRHRSPAIRCQRRNHGRFLWRNTLCVLQPP